MSSAEYKEKELAVAALTLLLDYVLGGEPVAFTALDAEGFHK